MQSVPARSHSERRRPGGGFGGAGGVSGLTDFARIGTSMEALLWAFLGGWAARYFASGRDQNQGEHSLFLAASACPS